MTGNQRPDVLAQSAVIAYRVLGGKMRVLLVTSRDTKRWIIPKGNVDMGRTPAEAAQIEAFEEAGLKGSIASRIPLGVYTYFKATAPGELRPASVEVYLFKVEKVARNWPEKGQRQFAWMSVTKAIERIEEPSVIPLLRRVREIEKTLIRQAAA
jgi:8-oxo-dGTP pyrophosphatase MutT (NUDIX family)